MFQAKSRLVDFAVTAKRFSIAVSIALVLKRGKGQIHFFNILSEIKVVIYSTQVSVVNFKPDSEAP